MMLAASIWVGTMCIVLTILFCWWNGNGGLPNTARAENYAIAVVIGIGAVLAVVLLAISPTGGA